MTTKKFFLSLLLAAMMCVPFTAGAQVTVGAATPPQSFSVLELISNETMGLRLPQIESTERRNYLFDNEAFRENPLARGLQIFNMETRCVEVWNGDVWIEMCAVLKVEPEQLVFDANGNLITPANNRVSVTANVNWTAVSNLAWAAVSPASGTGNGTFVVNVQPNTENNSRTATLTITGGGITRIVRVTQKSTNLTGGHIPVHGFVGAFWRDNQWGERLIRMPYNSDWTAIALDPWIVLDRELTFEHGDGECDVCMTTQDHLHRLPASAGNRVTGTGNIYFRIGLDGENPGLPGESGLSLGTRTPRFGQVLVLWGENQQNTHIIWVRQGEAAHYVKRVGDPGVNTNRTTGTIRRWSPFNLTHHSIRDNNTAFADVPARNTLSPGDDRFFVRYPSQAGAFFQWAGQTNPRRAWNPHQSTVGDLGAFAANEWWNTLRDNHETCPPGYRRPNDGAIDRNVATNNLAETHSSEIRQSLFLNPPVGGEDVWDNSVWGFYADGFFDRREITMNRFSELSIVAAGTSQVAYIGMLFFNPITRYHLFFPAAGDRGANGNLSGSVGTFGFYWSSTMSDLLSEGPNLVFQPLTLRVFGGWAGWDFDNDVPQPGSDVVPTSIRRHGYSVRCVRE